MWSQSIYVRSASGDGSSFNPAAATRWDRINNTLARRMQDQVAAWGVQINWVRIQDLTPLPVALPTTSLHLLGDTGGTTQIMPHEAPRTPATEAAPTATATPAAKADAPSTPAPAQPATPAPAAAPKPAAAKKLPRVETLVDTYDAVRQGAITDPKLILELADHFDTLANDPVANTTITFDAARAASTLRQRAQKYQNKGQS